MLTKIITRLSSMTTAIFLLCIVALAAVIGSFVAQDLPDILYRERFSTLTYHILHSLGIFHLYSSQWFIGLLAFLILSTLLCVIKQQLKKKHEKKYGAPPPRRGPHHYCIAASPQVIRQQYARQHIQTHTYHDLQQGIVTLYTRHSAHYHYGYLGIHIGMITLLIAALFNSNLLYLWFHQEPTLPAQDYRPWISFRANVTLLPHQKTSTGSVMLHDHLYQQHLPFTLQLIKAQQSYYADGTPSTYQSSLRINQAPEVRLTVNHPIRTHCCTLYQTGMEERYTSITVHLWDIDLDRQTIHHVSPHNLYQWHTNTLFHIHEATTHSIRIHQDSSAHHPLKNLIMGDTHFDTHYQPNDLGPSLTYSLDHDPHTQWTTFLQPYTLLGSQWSIWSYTHQGHLSYLLAPLDQQHRLDTFFHIVHLLRDSHQWPLLIHQLLKEQSHSPNPHLWASACFALLSKLRSGQFTDLLEAQAPYPPTVKTALIDLLRALLQSANSLVGHPMDIRDPGRNEQWINRMLYAITTGHALTVPYWLSLQSEKYSLISHIQVRHASAESSISLAALAIIGGLFMMIFRRPRQESLIWQQHHPHHGILFTGEMMDSRHPLASFAHQTHTDAHRPI